jgi:nucleotide-binding universal stress UspA family protein
LSETKGVTKLDTLEAPAAASVLVAYDGSAGGRDALELARLLCTAEDARCIVGTCLEYGPVPVRTGLGDAEDPEASALLAEAKERLRDLKVETHVVGTRAPARMLADFARRNHVGTIVVGSPHRGTVGRALLGSVSEHLLHRAPCEVVVAPRGYASARHTGLSKIAVAYDGTDVAKSALRRAGQIAARCGAVLEIIVAEDIVVSGGPGGLGIRTRRSAAEVTEEAVASVDPAIKTEGKVVDPGWRQVVGEVAEAIAATCSEDVDLLLLGSKKGSERLLYGSVSRRLIADAPCPVLVVPRAT